MNRQRLSIFNSKAAPAGGEANAGGWAHRLAVGAWVLVWLIVIDVAINLAFAYPGALPPGGSPGRLAAFFDYGRSVEGKIRRVLGEDDESAWPIAFAGHLGAAPVDLPDHAGDGQDMLVAVYGMSHANRLGRAVLRTHDRVAVRRVTAPGATANWAYAAFESDRTLREADAVVLGILTSNVPMLRSMSPMAWSFEQPYPYVQPIFKPDGGGLDVISPGDRLTLAQVRETFSEPDALSDFVDRLGKNDPYFSGYLFHQTILDRSTLARLVRRAHARRIQRRLAAQTLRPDGFVEGSEAIVVLKALIGRFSEQAKTDGSVPVVYLANDFGMPPYLHEVLERELKRLDIPVLSSHTVAETENAQNYLADGHFVDAIDDALAVNLVKLIEDYRATR